MSRLIALLCCLSFAFSSYAAPARRISIGKNPVLTMTKNNVEIVVPAGSTKVAAFAASELKKILGESFKGSIPVVNKINNSKVSIVLGENALSKRAGISLNGLPRDAYIIKTVGKDIYILGKDSAKQDPVRELKRGIWAHMYERGTLFGVYGFLEDVAGVRFYFPGKMGTVVPKYKDLKVGKLDIVYYPDFTTRKFSFYSGKWYEGNNRDKKIHPGKNLNMYRLRMETFYVPNCHGLARLGYLKRFGKSNPEYFALTKTGERHNNPAMPHPGQLCYNSKVREEIAKDAIAYLRDPSKASAQARNVSTRSGRHGWDPSAVQPGYFNVMPQDALYPCRCAKCKKYFDGTEQDMSEFIWEFTADIANRVKKAGAPGKVTMMAYHPYQPVPKTVTLPDNVMVMTAIRGPWNEHLSTLRDRDDQLVKDWVKKCRGEKTWLWTYTNKYGKLDIPGLPSSTPEEVGNFYKRQSPYIFGAYMQSSCDYYLFIHLNAYVFSKVCWDNKTDVKALLKEYYQKMYGSAAPAMEKIFKRLSHLWLSKIAGNPIDTPLGPQCIPPADYQVWEEIYSPKELASLNKQFDQAEKLAKKNKEALMRVKFMRKEFFGPLLAAAKKYGSSKNEIADLKFSVKKVSSDQIKIDGKLNDSAWKKSGKIYLAPFRGGKSTVTTTVSILKDDKYLYIGFDCEEPEMDKIVAGKRAANDSNIWRDSGVEIFLNPSGDRKNYYQFMINAAGSMVDIKCKKIGSGNTGDIDWNSNAKYAVLKGKDNWTAEIAIPVSSLKGFNKKGFPANFNRNRVLKTDKKYQKLFTWSPFIRQGFHDLQNFGSIVFGKIKDSSILNNPDFSVKARGRNLGKWIGAQKRFMKPGQFWGLDKSTYMVGGQSLKISDTKGTSKICLTQMLPQLKPNTKYLLTFFIKTEDIKPMGAKACGAVVNIWGEKNQFIPRNWYTGTMPWTKQGFEIRTGPNTNGIYKLGRNKGKKMTSYIRLFLMRSTGTVWFDDVRLREIK